MGHHRCGAFCAYLWLASREAHAWVLSDTDPDLDAPHGIIAFARQAALDFLVRSREFLAGLFFRRSVGIVLIALTLAGLLAWLGQKHKDHFLALGNLNVPEWECVSPGRSQDLLSLSCLPH